MKTIRFLLAVLASLCLAHSAFAQATRTWVSGVGDDANPCSRTAPGKTFAGCISKTAAAGEIDALDPGGFGALTITKSITIDGGPGNLAGVLVAGTPGFSIVNTTGSPMVVTLRNLDINGIGGQGTHGITVSALSTSQVILHVENCQIYGFLNNGIDFEPAAGSALYVEKTHIENCGGTGIYLKPGATSTASVRNTQVDDCAVGVHGDASTTTVVRDSSSEGNTGAGFETAAGAKMTIEDSETSLNGVGLSSTGTAVISGVGVTNNVGAGLVRPTGGIIQTFHNNPVGDNGTATVPVLTAVPLR